MLVVCCLRSPPQLWFGGVGDLVCWCPCMCVTGGACHIVVWWCWCVGGVSVVCRIGGCCTRLGVWCGCLCGGANVCVCCVGLLHHGVFGVLVVWWFGGWWCVVLVCLVLVVCCVGVTPLWCGVLVGLV